MTSIAIQGWGGVTALLIGHCAGMLDLVALPVWVGAALIGAFGLPPQQAGLLVTLFLGGQVLASLVLAPRFGRWPPQRIMGLGFGLGMLAFGGLFMFDQYSLMALLHLLGGLGAGTALSCTHGLMGRSANPHRLFAMAGLALGLFGTLVLGTGTVIVERAGAPTLFLLFAFAMLVATLASVWLLPRALVPPSPMSEAGNQQADQPSGADVAGSGKLPLSAAVWMGMAGIGCMSLANAMMFSFVERIGTDRGYGLEAVTGVLIAMGIFNLLPPILAALLEKRLDARRVLLAGPVCQILLALLITRSDAFALFAPAVVVWVGIMIFTHTFLFGLLARLDRSGRAVAATPAMLMIGSAIGPLLSGTIVQLLDYRGLGIAVALVALAALICFLQLQRKSLALPEASCA